MVVVENPAYIDVVFALHYAWTCIFTCNPLYPSKDITMTSIAQSAIAKLKDAGLGDVLHVPGEQAYQAKEGSLAPFSQRLGPWAIVQPRNTEEVSKALKALVSTEGLKFAVRR